MAQQSMVDDLCNWEIINQSDFEINGGDYIDDEIIYDLVESLDSLSSSSLTSSSEEEDDDDDDDDDDDVVEEEVKVGPTIDIDVDDDVRVSDLGENHHVCYGDDDEEEEVDECESDDDDDDDGRYDMDDELVPWEVKDRFVRERIRKSGGKKSIGKMAKSTKKSALVFTRPGCVRGKHGLGLKVY